MLMGAGGGMAMARKMLVAGVALVGAILTGWLLLLSGSGRASHRGGVDSSAARTDPPPPSASPGATGLTVLGPAAEVAVTIVYQGCPDLVQTGTAALPPGLVGLTRGQTVRALPEFAVTSFAPDRLGLESVRPGCPRDRVTLTIRTGQVVVLFGVPGNLGSVVRKTDIVVRGLPPAVRLALERGVVVPAGQADQAVQDIRDGQLPGDA